MVMNFMFSRYNKQPIKPIEISLVKNSNTFRNTLITSLVKNGKFFRKALYYQPYKSLRQIRTVCLWTGVLVSSVNHDVVKFSSPCHINQWQRSKCIKMCMHEGN